MLLITHDRSLIDLVADRLWLTADGHIKAFKGDMDDYARFVLDRAKVGAVAPSQVAGSAALDRSDSPQKQAERDAARKAAKKRRRRGL